ncbi:MAG: bile acid:sodium symporter family protein [Pseudomonadota bacterium]|nr:bile acid:sodium symporter family protein [Pseudomonadota bacterium]
MYRSSFIFLIFFFLTLSLIFPEFFFDFKSFIPTLLGVVMFGMGMTLKISEIKRISKKPSWLIITILLQYTIMPVLAFLIVKIFNFSNEIAIGFIILGSCPGGTASNVIAYICGANVSLSIFCTFISTGLSVFLTPFLIFFLANESVIINLLDLVRSTFYIILLPVLAGILVKLVMREIKERYLKFFALFSEITIAFIIAIIFSINSDSLNNLSYGIVLAIMLHNIVGLSLAFFITNLLKYPNDVKKTVAIEVAMQNSGLGMTLALLHFSKIVALPSALFSLWHNISAAGLVYLWKKK